MNDIHFLTYADETFASAKNRIMQQANDFGVFKTITGYGPEDLTEQFRERYHDILSERRGGGYWLWRPYILKKKLDEIDDGDVLVFLDAGCTINIKGKSRFFEYVSLFDKSHLGLISFKYTSEFYLQRNWTVKEIFEYFNIDENSAIATSTQYSGGVIILKKNEHSKQFVSDFNKVVEEAPYLFTDKYNSGQAEYFKENRHDQSVSTMLRYLGGTIDVDINELNDKETSPFLITRLKK